MFTGNEKGGYLRLIRGCRACLSVSKSLLCLDRGYTSPDDGVVVLPAMDDLLPYMFGINEDRTIYLLPGERREPSEFKIKGFSGLLLTS